MRWLDECEAPATAYRLMKMISLAASWRSAMLPLLPDRVKAACRERRIVDVGCVDFAGRWRDDLRQCRAVIRFYGHARMVSFEALRPLAAERARGRFPR